MALDPVQLGKLLKPTHNAWAKLLGTTLHHKNGWVLQVRDVTFRPPYCTLIARVVNGEEKELHFNTEAFANGVFVSIEVEAESEETIEEAIAKEIEERQKEEEARQRVAAERKERAAREMTERAAKARAAKAETAAEIQALPQAEDRKRPDANITAAKRVEDWRNCLAARKITRLTHFTRLPNLASILARGLYPATDFKELPEQPLRNDEVRLDRRLDHVSLSVTHPNDALFWRWHTHTFKNDIWVVLSIDPAVLWELPCSMFFANAAAGGGRTPVTQSEQPLASDFEKLFVELSDGPQRVQLGHALMDATNPQAEVMIRSKIAPTFIRGIGVRSQADHETVRQLAGVGASDIPLTVESWLFDMRRCATVFRRVAMAAQQSANPLGSVLDIDSFEDDTPF
jgi:hypothetical protein